MKAGPKMLLELLKPVLDTYSDCPVALVGCRSLGIERDSCEYDLLVVSDERRPDNSVRVGGQHLDISFVSEKEALKPSDPERAVSMAYARTVRDSALLLSSGCSAARAVLSDSSARSAEGRLALSLKAMGRADEALSRQAVRDADFWLLAAAYDYAFAWLYSAEVMPAPSHLLGQLKENIEGRSEMFEAFAGAAGLEQSSRADCDARLDSVAVLYDVLDTPGQDPELGEGRGRISYEVAKRKAAALADGARLADCYAFLGCEVVEALPHMLEPRRAAGGKVQEQSMLVSLLSKGEEKMISESVIDGLGIRRPRESVEAGLRSLRKQVSELTRTSRP